MPRAARPAGRPAADSPRRWAAGARGARGAISRRGCGQPDALLPHRPRHRDRAGPSRARHQDRLAQRRDPARSLSGLPGHARCPRPRIRGAARWLSGRDVRQQTRRAAAPGRAGGCGPGEVLRTGRSRRLPGRRRHARVDAERRGTAGGRGARGRAANRARDADLRPSRHRLRARARAAALALPVMDTQPRSADHDSLIATGVGVALGAPCDPVPYLKVRKLRKFMGLQDDLAVVAAGRALHAAGRGAELGERAGLYLAVGAIPFDGAEIDALHAASSIDGRFSMHRFASEGYLVPDPLLTFRCLPNMPAFHVSVNFDVQGPYFATYPGPGQLYAALDAASAALRTGTVDVALVVGVAHQRNFLVE